MKNNRSDEDGKTKRQQQESRQNLDPMPPKITKHKLLVQLSSEIFMRGRHSLKVKKQKARR
ncbi:MAG: hypothetical protein AAB383_03180 [Patescibacteria group bacterium]